MEDVGDEQIAKMIHPLYYSFDEYLVGIERGDDAYDAVDSVVAKIVKAQLEQSDSTTGLASILMKGMPDKVKG